MGAALELPIEVDAVNMQLHTKPTRLYGHSDPYVAEALAAADSIGARVFQADDAQRWVVMPATPTIIIVTDEGGLAQNILCAVARTGRWPVKETC